MADTTYADALTIVAAQRAGTRFDCYEQYILIRPHDDTPEWFILGERPAGCDELEGPFSTRNAARHFLHHALLTICPRPVLEVR